MATYKQMVAGLSDDFKARDIARLVYFHCDHFEPWQSFGGRDALDERHAEHPPDEKRDRHPIPFRRKQNEDGQGDRNRADRDCKGNGQQLSECRQHALFPSTFGTGNTNITRATALAWSNA